MKGIEKIEIVRGEKIFAFLQEGLNLASSHIFPSNVNSPLRRLKAFKDAYPYYKKMPNDFLRGVYERGEFVTDGLKGIKVSKNLIKFRSLGEISFKPISLIKITNLKVEDGSIFALGISRRKSKPKFEVKKHEETNLNELKKEDDILYHLMVNQAYTEFGPKRFWKLYDTIEYFRKNPDLTRRDLEKLGVRSDKIWELITDFDPALSVWIKSGSKPKDTPNYFHSKNQTIQRDKPLRRMPDVITSNDMDSGNLAGQSFEAEVFKSSSSSKEGWFS